MSRLEPPPSRAQVPLVLADLRPDVVVVVGLAVVQRPEQVAGVDDALRHGELLREPHLQADAGAHAGLAHRRLHGAQAGQVERHRLLDDQVLAGLRRGDRLLGVEPAARAEVDHVDVGSLRAAPRSRAPPPPGGRRGRRTRPAPRSRAVHTAATSTRSICWSAPKCAPAAHPEPTSPTRQPFIRRPPAWCARPRGACAPGPPAPRSRAPRAPGRAAPPARCRPGTRPLASAPNVERRGGRDRARDGAAGAGGDGAVDVDRRACRRVAPRRCGAGPASASAAWWRRRRCAARGRCRARRPARPRRRSCSSRPTRNSRPSCCVRLVTRVQSRIRRSPSGGACMLRTSTGRSRAVRTAGAGSSSAGRARGGTPRRAGSRRRRACRCRRSAP